MMGEAAEPKISLRLDFVGGRLGPGKIALLERIAASGSISAAGRSAGMSYRRAWSLVADLNALFQEPLVETRPGGRDGGGASLTGTGYAVIDAYRTAERASADACRTHLLALSARMRSGDRGS